MNPNGEAQAQCAAGLLASAHIASIAASPFARTRRTAEIVAAALGLEVIYEPDLREVVFPGKEGQPLAGWFDSWLTGITPLGAESFAELALRAERAVGNAQRLPSPVLIISHGGFFRALRAAMHLSIAVRTPNGVPIFCSPPTTPTGAWSLEAPRSFSLAGLPDVSG